MYLTLSIGCFGLRVVDSAVRAHPAVRTTFIIERRVAARIGRDGLLLFDRWTILRQTESLDWTMEELDRDGQDERERKNTRDA